MESTIMFTLGLFIGAFIGVGYMALARMAA